MKFSDLCKRFPNLTVGDFEILRKFFSENDNFYFPGFNELTAEQQKAVRSFTEISYSDILLPKRAIEDLVIKNNYISIDPAGNIRIR